jgi:hypothetical protein
MLSEIVYFFVLKVFDLLFGIFDTNLMFHHSYSSLCHFLSRYRRISDLLDQFLKLPSSLMMLIHRPIHLCF